MPGKKKKIGARVSDEVYREFVDFVVDKHGTKKGNVGRELEKAMKSWTSGTDVDALERRMAGVESRLDALADAVSHVEPERENESSSDYNARTERKVDSIVEALPTEADVGLDIVEHVIEEHGGTARKTVQKYKRLLRNRGHAFPDPRDGASVDDINAGTWVVGRSKFAMRMEATDDFSPDDVDAIVGHYSEYLGEDWYLDALPNDWLETNRTKLERVDDQRSVEQVEEYRQVHGLLDGVQDGRRGFQ